MDLCSRYYQRGYWEVSSVVCAYLVTFSRPLSRVNASHTFDLDHDVQTREGRCIVQVYSSKTGL